MGLGTVTTYLQRAAAAGLSWPLPEDLDDGALEARLFAAQESLSSQHWVLASACAAPRSANRDHRCPGICLGLCLHPVRLIFVAWRLAQKLASVLKLSPSTLPMSAARTSLKPEEATAALGAVGYPGFAHLRKSGHRIAVAGAPRGAGVGSVVDQVWDHLRACAVDSAVSRRGSSPALRRLARGQRATACASRNACLRRAVGRRHRTSRPRGSAR